jgi:phosphatidate cytidylyltransferase
MSPLDESDHDDPRPARPTRPAWDAATYGTPDDLRRWPGGRDPRREPAEARLPAEAASAPAYPAEKPGYPAESQPEWEPPPWDPPVWDPPAWDAPSPSYPAAEPSYPAAEPSYNSSPTSYHPSHGASYETSYQEETSYEHEASYQTEYDSPYAYEPAHGAAYEPSHEHEYEYDERYPGGLDEDTAREVEQKKPRAGRNLPAAIGVGVGLGGIAAGSLFFWRPAFLGVLAVVVGIGIWELVRAIRISGVNPPLIPLIAGGGLMTGLAWWGHADALTFGLLVTVLAVMIWRLADGPGGYGRDVTSATLVAVYLPFMAGFAAMLASPADGDLRVIVTLAGVVLSDTGGYIAGVFFGKHPMAPSVSPKKSWEGLAGSLVATGVGGALLLPLAFDVHWYWGLLFGVLVSAAAVVGDLGESMIKRDLGVKDMSNLLPGHGGFMDRLDSILIAAPTAYALLAIMAPVA